MNGERKKTNPNETAERTPTQTSDFTFSYMNIEATTRRKGEFRIRKRRSSENLEEEEWKTKKNISPDCNERASDRSTDAWTHHHSITIPLRFLPLLNSAGCISRPKKKKKRHSPPILTTLTRKALRQALYHRYFTVPEVRYLTCLYLHLPSRLPFLPNVHQKPGTSNSIT